MVSLNVIEEPVKKEGKGFAIQRTGSPVATLAAQQIKTKLARDLQRICFRCKNVRGKKKKEKKKRKKASVDTRNAILADTTAL